MHVMDPVPDAQERVSEDISAKVKQYYILGRSQAYDPVIRIVTGFFFIFTKPTVPLLHVRSFLAVPIFLSTAGDGDHS